MEKYFVSEISKYFQLTAYPFVIAFSAEHHKNLILLIFFEITTILQAENMSYYWPDRKEIFYTNIREFERSVNVKYSLALFLQT